MIYILASEKDVSSKLVSNHMKRRNIVHRLLKGYDLPNVDLENYQQVDKTLIELLNEKEIANVYKWI